MPAYFSVNVKDRYQGLRAVDYFRIGGPTLIGLLIIVIISSTYQLPSGFNLVLLGALLVLFFTSNAIGFIIMLRSERVIQERFENEVFAESGLRVRAGDKRLRMDVLLDNVMPSHVTLTDGNRESVWIASIVGDLMLFQSTDENPFKDS